MRANRVDLVGAPLYSSRLPPEGTDIHSERTHLASNLPLVGRGEHAVLQDDTLVDDYLRTAAAAARSESELSGTPIQR